GGAGSSGGALNAALRWSGGPLALGASAWSATPEGASSSPAGQQKSVRVWGGYTLPMGLKVGLGFDGSQRRQAAGEAMTKRNACHRRRKRGAALRRLLVPLLKITSTDGARPGPFFFALAFRVRAGRPWSYNSAIASRESAWT